MYEEAQKLIENLYDNKIIFTKFNWNRAYRYFDYKKNVYCN